jgi:hypothetical protein
VSGRGLLIKPFVQAQRLTRGALSPHLARLIAVQLACQQKKTGVSGSLLDRRNAEGRFIMETMSRLARVITPAINNNISRERSDQAGNVPPRSRCP